MIADRMFLLSYCVNYQEIENYEEALNDPDTMWVCHHKDEIELNKSRKELIEMGLYYNIAPEKLIFLRNSEHMSLHNKYGKKRSYKRGPMSEETKQKMREAQKNKKISPESRQRMIDGARRGGLKGGKKSKKTVELIDTRTNKKIVFPSKGECMAYLKISSRTFSKLIKNYEFKYKSKLRFYKLNVLK